MPNEKVSNWGTKGIGWAYNGALGTILTQTFSAFFDKKKVAEMARAKDSPYSTKTQTGDFEVCFFVLASVVLKSIDKQPKELPEHIHKYIFDRFGEEHAEARSLFFQELTKHEVSLHSVCSIMKLHMPLPHRLQMVHFMFDFANSKGSIDAKELQAIYLISSYLGINEIDFISIRCMFIEEKFNDYKLLQISPKINDDEVKKSYRKMAVKFHPDKVSNMGAAIEQVAELKFQKVQEAYEHIKKKRGFN